jgi:hypothetical protein
MFCRVTALAGAFTASNLALYVLAASAVGHISLLRCSRLRTISLRSDVLYNNSTNLATDSRVAERQMYLSKIREVREESSIPKEGSPAGPRSVVRG